MKKILFLLLFLPGVVFSQPGKTYPGSPVISHKLIFKYWSGSFHAVLDKDSLKLLFDTYYAPISSAVTAANPTGQTGLTVVNGSATTYMRSDASTPLDQSIAPNWTGVHRFTQSTTGTTIPVLVNPTQTASSNSQVQVGFKINPTYSDGSFTNVIHSPFGIDWGITRLYVSNAIADGTASIHATSAPTNANYFVASDNNSVRLNAPNGSATGTILFRVGNTTVAQIGNTGIFSSGVAGSLLGTYQLSGNTSGTVSIKPQAAAGTYNFNLPTTAGTSGQVLTSAGGVNSPMAWTDMPTFKTINSTAITGSGNINLQTPLIAGTDYTTPTGTETLTNKSVSGSANTFSNIPYSVLTGAPSTIGRISPLDSLSGTSSGAQVSGRNLVLQSATSSIPGLINTGTQSFGGNKSFTGTASFNNTYSSSSTPTIVVGAQAGTGATASIVGSNQDGIITINTGTGPLTGIYCTVTMSGGFSYPNSCTPVISHLTSGAVAGIDVNIDSLTPNSFKIYVNGALAASATYSWTYHNGGY